MPDKELKRQLKAELKANELQIKLVKRLVKENQINSEEPGFNSYFSALLVRSFQLELEIAKL